METHLQHQWKAFSLKQSQSLHDDTLIAVAKRLDCTVQDLASLNRITNPNLIYSEQTINLPTKCLKPPEHTHTFAKGDTLWDISKRYNTTVSKLN